MELMVATRSAGESQRNGRIRHMPKQQGVSVQQHRLCIQRKFSVLFHPFSPSTIFVECVYQVLPCSAHDGSFPVALRGDYFHNK